MLIQDQFGIIRKPSAVPYSPNQFLGWDFFCRFLQKDGTNVVNKKGYAVYKKGLEETLLKI